VRSAFDKTMEFIYKWEGGCADHPNDPGGRTYRGITTRRARLSGWYEDVCKMPHNLVDKIYHEDYWQPRAAKYPWPLCLAVMNTEVNSGGGKAQQFLDETTHIELPAARAIAIANKQKEYYHDIVRRRPKMKVFLAGWLNRAKDLQHTIYSY